jgi:hypothetical protein
MSLKGPRHTHEYAIVDGTFDGNFDYI